MARYSIQGQVIPGAAVVVYEGGSTTPATIYAAETGELPLAGGVATGDVNGRAVFYVEMADYSFMYAFDIKVVIPGYADTWIYGVWAAFSMTGGVSLVPIPAPVAVSVVDICNEALVLIGQDEIVALTDATSRAKVCNRLYPSVRDAVLRAYPWNCAMVYAALTVDAAPPAWGFTYRYALPNDCLRVVYLDSDTGTPSPLPVWGDTYSGAWLLSSYWMTRFKVVGRWFYSNQTTANIRYISRVTDPGLWDTLLKTAIIERLAAQFSIPLKGDKALAKAQMEIYMLTLREARGVDGQEGIPDKIESTDLTDFRL